MYNRKLDRHTERARRKYYYRAEGECLYFILRKVRIRLRKPLQSFATPPSPTRFCNYMRRNIFFFFLSRLLLVFLNKCNTGQWITYWVDGYSVIDLCQREPMGDEMGIGWDRGVPLVECLRVVWLVWGCWLECKTGRSFTSLHARWLSVWWVDLMV